MAMLPSLMAWESTAAAYKELESVYTYLASLRLPWGVGDRLEAALRRGDKEQQLDGQQQDGQRGNNRLRSTLQAAACVDGVGVWRARLLSTASVVQFGGLLSAVSSLSLSPQGPGCCDFNRFERASNVATSLPYAAIGLHSLKHRRTVAGKLWGASMLGVCGGSIVFHTSSGRHRELGRRLDYWMIALSSALLTRALFPGLPPAATAACLASTPFKPFLVTTGNALALEGRFLQRALENPDLRGAQKLHSAACLAGMAVFAVEDASVPHVPLVHASWHCLSALSTSLVNCVLADTERRFPHLTLDALAAPLEVAGGGTQAPAPSGERGSRSSSRSRTVSPHSGRHAHQQQQPACPASPARQLQQQHHQHRHHHQQLPQHRGDSAPAGPPAFGGS